MSEHRVTQHTRGPWSASTRYVDAASVLDVYGFPIAELDTEPILEAWHVKFPHLHHWADGSVDEQTQIERPIDEVRANARLIAAAPDLLAALQQFVTDHEASGHYCEGLNAAYTQAITAIARAEGRHDA